MGKFRHRGVISVWGADDDDKSKLIDILYKGIINGWFKGFHGVFYANKSDHVSMLCKGLMADSLEIRRHSWVDVPDPFDLRVFAQRLFLNCHSDDIRASEITKVGESETDLIQSCGEFLFEGKYLIEEEQCLVVINGLRSTDDWELIKSKFLFGPIRGCILVVTNEETVAMHCVKDHQKYQVFNVKDLKADTSISRLINMGSWHYGIRGKKCRLLSDRRNDALEWTSKFKNVDGNNQDEGKDEEEFGVFTVTESAEDIYYLQGILRHAYYGAFPQIKRRSWVDVPHTLDATGSFSLHVTDFAWRLLLDFYSDDPQAKEAVAVGLMEGTIIDPIEKCREFLRNEKCLVVINDLSRWHGYSDTYWDLIKDTFFSDSEPIQSIIIVNSPFNRSFSNAKMLPLGNQRGFRDTFYKIIHGRYQRQLNPQEAERSKSIVSKCGGLPKVITAVADYGSDYGYGTWMGELLSDNFMGTLESNPRFRALRPLFSWMQSYFDACSDSLKPCIFYLSIFPPAEKKNIRRRRLLCRWIAEGYCRDTSDGKTCEENGEDYISDLVDLSIIQWSARSTSYQQSEKMNKVFCEINGFFHEYIISRPMEDNLVFALEKDCSLNSTRGGQHLTIRSTWDRRDRIVYESIDFSRLRSLTIFGKWESFFISNSKNVNMMRLISPPRS